MTEAVALPAGKKRGRKPANDNEGGTNGTPKKQGGGRKPKNVDRAAAPSPMEDDEEKKPNKKVKVEVKDEDEEEEGMIRETKGQEDGVAA